jgi:hypothetical protein
VPTRVRKPRELSQDEWRKLVNKLAQHYFSMSADEFATALKAGRLDPDRPEVMRLAMLLPNGR